MRRAFIRLRRSDDEPHATCCRHRMLPNLSSHPLEKCPTANEKGLLADARIDSMAAGDQRKTGRVSFSKGIPARIIAIDGTWSRECVMLDIGDTGAKLE